MFVFERVSAQGWVLVLAVATAAHIGCDSSSSAPSADSGEAAAVEPATASVTSSGETAPQPVASTSPASGGEFPIDAVAADQGHPTATPSVGAVATAGGISLQTVDADAYAQVVAKHKGRVVLVDFWATWCGPCTEQFPHTVELARKWQDQGLTAVSVSFDDPEKQQNALEFLQKQGASFDNLISQHGAGVQSGVAFDIVGGALPFYKLYDRSGQLRYQFTGNVEGLEGVLKTEELDQRIEELLKAGK